MPQDVENNAIGGAQLSVAARDIHDEKPQLVNDITSAAKDGTISHKVSEELEDFPSEEDLLTLRRVSAHIPWKVYSIAFVEACERFSYYGTTIVVNTNFIQQPLPTGSRTGAGGADGQSGALGMGQRASTGITTFNTFWQYFMPLLGAWIADAHWGRFKTISIALGIDIIGHLIVVMSAIPPVITKPHNSLAALIIAILVIGFGTGGFKPNINPLIVEQIPTKHLKVITLKTGERVIVDPAITISRVYNWFYLFINVGSLIGQLTMVYAEKYVGFWLAFLLPTMMLCFCPLVMWFGRHIYQRREPQGSLLGKAMRTWFLAMKGRFHINPVTTWKRLHSGDFWDHVKPSRLGDRKPKWMNFDDAFVDELRRGFSACAVFCWYPIYWLTYSQLNNNLISQAAVMKLNGLPNDVFTNLDPLALIIFIPICDFFIYPALRKAKIKFTPIKRIAAGFFTGAASMVWACVIQYYIYKRSSCGDYASGTDCPPVDINVWAQTGSYVLIALSEIFASITSLEYAYSKAPKSMRSFVQAVALFANAISAALGEAFVSLSADPLLVWNYGVMAVLAFVSGIIFWFQFRSLDEEEDQLNELPEGEIYSSNDEEQHRPALAANQNAEEEEIKHEKS